MRRIFILSALLLAPFVGCGSSGEGVQAVKGTVELNGADRALLAGHIVEARLAGNPDVRASGTITPEGTFELETLQEGKLLQGAKQGSYEVRLILADDDPALRRQTAAKLDPKQLAFETSGLKLEVPASSAVLQFRTRR